MDRIDQLLEKYFQGTTTLQEEQELKLYFSSEEVFDKHKEFQPLFDLFSVEKKATYPAAPQSTQKRALWIKVSAFSGIAASIALVTMLLFTPGKKPTDTYLVINGNKLQDEQLAQQYAEDKLSTVCALLNKGLQPIELVETNLLQSLDPLNQTEKALTLVSKYESKLIEFSNTH